jgi:hypothetical protein
LYVKNKQSKGEKPFSLEDLLNPKKYGEQEFIKNVNENDLDKKLGDLSYNKKKQNYEEAMVELKKTQSSFETLYSISPSSSTDSKITKVINEKKKALNQEIASIVISKGTEAEILSDVATGNLITDKDLKDRIDALKDKIIVPKALLDGLHDLRLLGNDAAHVNSKDFDNVGKEEVEAAIEVTKELLKAIYQHENLIKKLASLKKTNA